MAKATLLPPLPFLFVGKDPPPRRSHFQPPLQLGMFKHMTQTQIMKYKGKSIELISGKNFFPSGTKEKRKETEMGEGGRKVGKICIRRNCPALLFFHLKLLYENIVLGVAETIQQARGESLPTYRKMEGT